MSDARNSKCLNKFVLMMMTIMMSLGVLTCNKNLTEVDMISAESALRDEPFIKSVETVIATSGMKYNLKNKDGGYASMVVASGYLTPTDGNGGMYRWTDDVVALDDGVNVIVPALRPRTGSWKKVYLTASPTLQAGIVDQGDVKIVGSLAWLIKNKIKTDPGTINLSTKSIYTIKTNLTIPSNVRLRFQDGAKIVFADSSTTLKIFGVIEAGLFQIFDTTISGQVRLQAKDDVGQYRISLTKEVYPQWWGASGETTADAAKNHDAFQAAIVAFPTKVFVPAGKYVIKGSLSIDMNDQPDANSGMPFEISGVGQELSILTPDSGSASIDPFVSIKANYPEHFWAYAKFHDLTLNRVKNVGLLVQTPLTHIYDIYVHVEQRGGIGIDVGPTSISCVFERIFLYGPGPYITADQAVAYLDSDPTPLSVGLRTRGGNNANVRVSSISIGGFEVGINLYSVFGAVVGWKIEHADIEGALVGIALSNSPDINPYNSIDILETYMEMSGTTHARGIRINPVYPMHACRVVGGRIDPKGLDARPIVVNGYKHVIDVSYGGTYGNKHETTQLRFGDLVGPE